MLEKINIHNAGTTRCKNEGELLLEALAAEATNKPERVALDKDALKKLGLDALDFTLKFEITRTEPVGCTKLPFINLPFINFYIVMSLFADGIRVKCWYVQV